MKQKTAAIVVTYNRSAMLRECVQALLVQNRASCDILIVDNHSTDNTKAVVGEFADPRVFYHDTGANLGGAGGFHFGLRWAVEHGYSYIWIMDDDTIPQPDALFAFLTADQKLDGKYGFLVSAALWTDGTDCKMNRPKVKRSYYDYLPLVGDGLLQVEYATFVSMFLKSETVRKVGLPIKEYFIWGDDIEYTKRIEKKYQMPGFLVGNSKVVHRMATNDGSDIVCDKEERLGRYFYAYRNEAHLYRQYGVKGICYYFARCAKHLLRVWFSAPNLRMRRTLIILKGIVSGFVFRPRIETL